jgi:hypothetical protein
MSDTILSATSTLRAKKDYFGLVTTIGATKIKVTGSKENPSAQTTSGQNTFGDPVVVDVYGQTAAPSSEYEVIGGISGQAITLGVISTANAVLGTASLPVCLGSLSIATQTGSAPKITASGQALFTGATQLRAYKLPAFTLSPRHRAQNIFANPLVTIKYNTSTEATPINDYGLSSVNANFPIEFTLAQPQGTLLNYDLHGGTVTVDYAMNWYRTDYEPEIAINTSAYTGGVINIQTGESEYFAAPLTLTKPVGRSDPENNYTQYTWQVSFPLVGAEAPSNS